MPTYTGPDGTPLHYDEGSDSSPPPVVVLAGGAARHPSYLGDLAGLGERHRLIVPHLRGVGRSPLPESEQQGSFWRQAEDLEQLRRHLGLERLVVVAHSAGTRLAVAYAAQFPHRLAGMALITPPAGYLVDLPSDVDELVRRRHGDQVFEAAVVALRAGPDTADDDAFNAWHRRTAPTGYAAWGPRERAHARTGDWHLAAARAYFSVEPPPDLPARLGAVTAPVLVVAGAEDCLTGLAPVVALAKLFPAGRAVSIDACGHYPWVEQPLVFREAVAAFLDDCAG